MIPIEPAPVTAKETFVNAELDQLFQVWLCRVSTFGALIFLLFGGLDYFITPENFSTFIKYRLANALLLLNVAFLSRRIGNRHLLAALAYAAILSTAIVQEVMIVVFGGSQSTYFAGMILLGVCVIGFIPARLSFHLPAASLILLTYVLPLLFLEQAADSKILLTHTSFITAMLSTVLYMRYHSQRRLVTEIGLRAELRLHKEELEGVIASRTAQISRALEELKQETAQRKQIEEDLRKSSGEWRATYDATGEMVVMVDEGFRVIKVNRAVAVFFDKPYPQLLGKDCFELFSDLDFPPDSHPLRLVQQSLRREQAEAFVTSRSTWLDTSAYPIFDESGRTIGSVFTLNDITDRKRSEEEKQILQAEMIQIQKMDSIGRLAGGIAHDFNNILSAILGFGELSLMQLPEGHPVRENVDIIINSAEKAGALTQQLLAFSRKQALAMEVVNVNTVVEDMAKMLHRVIKENINLELSLAPRVRSIIADRGQLEQVILNLVINARDAIHGQGKVSIATSDVTVENPPLGGSPAVKEGAYVLLSVTDTGEGISADIEGKMFEPFFTTKEQGKGTGLGLSTVYGIVKQHGGFIEVDSSPGRGATFHVYFSATEAQVKDELSPHKAGNLRGTERILVVDDDSSVRKMVVAALRENGYLPIEAATAEEALRFCDEDAERVDLLLTDLIMPGISGSRLAETFHNRKPETRIVIMSGHIGYALDPDQLAKTGAVFLRKPLVPSTFLRLLREVLDSPKISAPS